jgi:hypothetical protein
LNTFRGDGGIVFHGWGEEKASAIIPVRVTCEMTYNAQDYYLNDASRAMAHRRSRCLTVAPVEGKFYSETAQVIILKGNMVMLADSFSSAPIREKAGVSRPITPKTTPISLS